MLHDWGSRDARFIAINRAVLERLPALIQGEAAFVTVPMQGSGTLTVKGRGRATRPSSEMTLACGGPATARSFLNACLQALPDAIEVTDAKKLLFTATTDASQDDAASTALLPAGFLEALFTPSAAGGALALRLDPDALPSRFELRVPTGSLLLNHDTWATGHARATEVSVAVDRPVSSLAVHWRSAEGDWQAAPWVVNVTDTALLPPPSEQIGRAHV